MKKWISVIVAISLMVLPLVAMSCGSSAEEEAEEEAMEMAKDSEEALEMAKEHLATRLGIEPADISLVKMEKVDWPDTSLGVPEPGKMYAQVITPGYRIILSAEGKDYTYHAGKLDGKMTVVPAPQ